MIQARGVSYDDIITKILPLTHKIISKSTAQKTSSDFPFDQKTVDNAIQKIAQLADDVKAVKNVEKDPDKLSVLHDASLLLSLLQWSAGLKQQSDESPFSFVYSVSKCLLWSKMPRFIVDNRGCVELSNDILSKSESVKQKQSKFSQAQ